MADIDAATSRPQPEQRQVSAQRAARRGVGSSSKLIARGLLIESLPESPVLSALVAAAIAAAMLLPPTAAGALTAVLAFIVVLALHEAGAGAPRLLLAAAVPMLVGLTTVAALDRLAAGEQADERRALLARNAALDIQATAPGSMLGCLDAAIGEEIAAACEKATFATPQSIANATAYVAARLSVLDAAASAKKTDPGLLRALAATRRAVEIDRYGLAAHILVTRDGCNADRCAEFAVLRDTAALRAHMREQAFAGYVSHYAQAWGTSEAKNESSAGKPVTENPPAGSATQPVAGGYDYPSAASIPPVSIMNAEPSAPKEAVVPLDEKPTGSIPVPPKSQQNRTAKPAGR